MDSGYFSSISTTRLNQQEIVKIFQKSKQTNFQVLSDMLKGRNPKTFLQRNSIEFSLSTTEKSKRGYYYRNFRIGPSRQHSFPFFVHNDFKNLVYSSFRSLTVLRLEACQLLTEQSFYLITDLKELKSLFVSDSKLFKDEHLIAIACHIKGLEELSIIGCPSLTNDSLIVLLNSNLRLTKLNLMGCRSIFSQFLYYKGFSNFNYLETLDLSDCGLEISQIVEIVRNCLSLKELFLGLSGLNMQEIGRASCRERV